MRSSFLWGHVVAGVLALSLAACSDDSAPTPDKGTTDGVITWDTQAADQGPGPEQGATEGGVTEGGAAEGGLPDGASGDAGPTFSLEITVDFGLMVSCDATDSDKDCAGELYWAVYDKPINIINPGEPMYAAIASNVQKGTVFTESGIPVKPALYMTAFLDDNANVNPTVPASIAPDKGDPVYYDAVPFTAQAGKTVKRKLSFQLRLP